MALDIYVKNEEVTQDSAVDLSGPLRGRLLMCNMRE
jgi:hypothetical protein